MGVNKLAMTKWSTNSIELQNTWELQEFLQPIKAQLLELYCDTESEIFTTSSESILTLTLETC